MTRSLINTYSGDANDLEPCRHRTYLSYRETIEKHNTQRGERGLIKATLLSREAWQKIARKNLPRAPSETQDTYEEHLDEIHNYNILVSEAGEKSLLVKAISEDEWELGQEIYENKWLWAKNYITYG